MPKNRANREIEKRVTKIKRDRDGWVAYERHIVPVLHTVGKLNTQKIERKHLTLRTRIKRLARKTICFSKSVVMHDVVIGLFINRVAFGLKI